jgi:asparagine synthase (glutamine-hydrolysing)
MFEYTQSKSVELQTLCDMLEVLRHRGPDDEGWMLDEHLALGNRRLSIIDLPGGKQPMYNEDGNVAIVFNGEIYNYPELAERLRQGGHVLRTRSDTEVIVHLYEDLKEDCVKELRGIFAFAIWDARRRRLFLARDHLGVKPLYYTEANGALIFASEIKAILQHPAVQARLDLPALSNYLSLKYVPSPQTMFQDIYALPPGHTLTCDATGIRTQPYWFLSFPDNHNGYQSEEAWADQLEALLRESVRMQLMSDVPFGAFLSGGVDSSTVVALMSQFLNEPVKTFAVGFEGEGAAEHSELPYARLVADKYHTDHHEILIHPEDLTGLAEQVIWHLDQPIADQASLANYMVAELASRHVKMVLTGEGGDELFAGYARYAGEQFASTFQLIPPSMKRLALDMAKYLPRLRRSKIALYALCQPDQVERLTNWFPLFHPEMKAALLSDAVKLQVGNLSAAPVFARQLAQTDARDPLSRMLYVDTKLWLPDDLLARDDKTCMASSLEARVPLLDHKLVEFAATLPSHLKVRGLQRKYLLKKVSRAWLPKEIIDRKKKGFPVPVSVWFRKEARGFVRDLLAPQVVRRRGLFDSNYVQQLLDQHESGFADNGSLIWGLLSVELWHRLYIDTARAGRERAASQSRMAAHV